VAKGCYRIKKSGANPTVTAFTATVRVPYIFYFKMAQWPHQIQNNATIFYQILDMTFSEE
jgi:hypothetical protein